MMKKSIRFILRPGIFIVSILLLVNCNGPKKIVEEQNPDSSLVQTDEIQMEPSGVQLWANNCNRCHNTPPPKAYSDQEWVAIVNHMQKVGGLTVTEADKISEYLRASN